jgi:acetyltransferase
MSIRNLDSLFNPASVAVIGASDRAGSVGATVWRNLHGRYGGALLAVNPRLSSLDGQPVVARVAELAHTPELAVVCTPPASVPGIVADLGARGTRAAVVITAGLSAAQKQAMLDAARPHLLRVLGPNCIGLVTPHLGLNASFAHVGAAPGDIAFLSQSGALMTALLDWAGARGIGFSHFASLGESADVDFGDLLDYLATDARTRAILMYVESVSAARKFMSAARAAARNKPVILVKSGRSDAGQAAARSHTGALAGSDRVFDAAVSRAGMLRVDTLHELFLAAETLARLRGHVLAADPDEHLARLFVLTNGGGAGVMAADAAVQLGLQLAPLAALTRQRLDEALPPNWSRANPVDIIGDAPAARYVAALQALLDDPARAPVLFIHAPTAIVAAADVADALLPLAREHPGRLLSCWLGEGAVAAARQRFQDARIPAYDTPEQAVRAWQMLVQYRRHQAQLLEAPPAAATAGAAADVAAARAVIAQALAAGREMLTEPESKAVLAAYGIPVVATRAVAAEPEAAVAAAEALGWPVALKILSAQITHKSDVGGVALNLADADALRAALAAMLERVRRLRPDAVIDGVTVQAMVRRGGARELIVGASIDPVFGPSVLFGAGGTAVEVLADRAVALPPLNAPLARALVGRTRVARLLAGYRDTPAVDRDALHAALIAVGQMLADLPQLVELDINPLLADDRGVIALDARVRASAAAPGGAERFAVRPYPAELVETTVWNGRALTLRPIRPEDEPQHREFLESLAPEDVRLRIFHSRRTLERSELARLTQIDYAREMAFVATAPGPDGRERTLGVVRAVTDPDNLDAEFGIVVRSDLKGGGLGQRLMHKIIAYQRAQGTRRLVATVLAENARMLDLARTLGFDVGPRRPDDDTRELALML